MRKKILSMMISICAANVLFAVDNYYYTIGDDGTLLQVLHPKKNVFQLKKDSSKVSPNKIFMLAKIGVEGNITLGENAEANGNNSTAIGNSSNANKKNATAIGYKASATESSVAVGANATASGPLSVAIGENAKSEATTGISIGGDASSKGSSSISIGYHSKSTYNNSIAIGEHSESNGQQAIAIGYNTKSKDVHSIAIGHSSSATSAESVAIGSDAKSTAESGIAIGDGTENRGSNSIAIGDDAKTANEQGQIAMGSNANSSGAYSTAMGYRAEALAQGSIAIGWRVTSEGLDSSAFGTSAIASARNSTAIGRGAVAKGEYSNALGSSAKATGLYSNAIGNSISSGEYSNALGSYAKSIGYNSNALGKYAKSIGGNSNAIGFDAVAQGGSSLAIGESTTAYGSNSIAIGKNAIVGVITNRDVDKEVDKKNNANKEINNALAIGNYSKAEVYNSVALGGESVANIGSGVIGLDFATNKQSTDATSTWRSTAGAVSVGDKTKNITRQITNVAAGKEDTDAVNVAQIKSLTNKGFFTEANLTVANANKVEKNKFQHKLGGIIKVGGNFKPSDGGVLSTANMDTYLSGENLATSIDDNGNINLLMAKTPKFDDINISKDGKGGDYTSLTQWIKGIENSSSTNSNIKYFSVKSKEDKGNFDNKGATGDYAIAIGPDTTAKGNSAIAVGNNANADSINSISIGEKAKAIGNNSISMGYQAEAYDKSMSIGYSSKAKGLDSIAIGGNAEASGLDGSGKFSRSVAIGQSAKATGYESNALGHSAEASKDEATAIGVEATATEKHSTALGARARALGEKSIAIGNQNYSRAYSSIAIGHHTDAKGNLSIALGEKSKAQADFSTAIGSHSIAKEKNSLALGVGSQANINNSVALGALSIADTEAGKEGKYFGVGKNDDKDTAAWTSRLGAVSVGRAKGYKDNKGNDLSELTRQITNVAAGTNDTDAVNVAQLKSLKDYSDKTFAKQTDLEKIQKNLNGKIFDIKGDNKNIVVEQEGTTSNSKKISLAKDLKDLQSAEFNKYDKNGNAVADKTTINNETIEIGDDKIKAKISKNEIVLSNENNNKSITIKNDDKGQHIVGLSNTKWNGTTDDVSRAATEGQLKELQENFTTNLNGTVNQTLGKYKLKGDEGKYNIYGNKTLTIKGDKNIKTKATEDGNLDIKLSKKLNLKDGSITFDKTKLDEDGLKVGDDVKITKDTIQNGDVKLTKDGLNNGGNKITKVADGEADDDAATVGQLKNIAVGASGVKESDKKDDWAKEKPKATGKNSVSIAGGSKDNGRSNTVSVGAPGHERTISNVAPGVLNSDAATVGQLKAGLNNVYGKLDEYKKDSRAGTASAMAIGNLPQSTIPGKGMVSLGGGFYDGESAMAIGLSKMSDDGKWVVKGSASYDSQENAGAAVSVGFHF